uniref:hypothetical protein n=1 Tax=Polynucleobacter sp. TaxID=2029855 RepID=UPI00404724D5
MTQENPNQPVEQDISAEESQQEAIDSSAQELNTPEQEITQLQEKLTEAPVVPQRMSQRLINLPLRVLLSI